MIEQERIEIEKINEMFRKHESKELGFILRDLWRAKIRWTEIEFHIPLDVTWINWFRKEPITILENCICHGQVEDRIGFIQNGKRIELNICDIVEFTPIKRVTTFPCHD